MLFGRIVAPYEFILCSNLNRYFPKMATTIWYYDRDGSFTDADSTGPGPLEDDPDDHQYTDTFTFADHVQLNTRNYNNLYKETDPLPNGRIVMRSPTASRIPSNCLHPWFYTQCTAIESLHELAVHLQAPNNWMARIDKAKRQNSLLICYQQLLQSSDGDEVISKI